MSDPIELTSIEFVEIPATVRTTWVMAQLGDAAGHVALVELTGAKTGTGITVWAEMAAAVAALERRPIGDDADVPALLGLTDSDLHRDFGRATAVSSIRSAIVQLQAAHAGHSLTEALGGVGRDSVQLYANINRSLLDDRSPAAHAAAAALAVERGGFEIIKCAPFDEVAKATAGQQRASDDLVASAAPGIARVAAVRAAVGAGVTVLVDCHRRFDEASAPVVCEQLAALDVGWFEEALDPGAETAALARVAAAVPLPVAGGESLYGQSRFERLITAAAVETIMPDVKHCGGVAEAARAGRAAVKAGRKVSLHSPSGPVSLLASAHVTAATDGASALEHAVDEVDWRAGLLSPGERVDGGRLWLPAGAGLGATLDEEAVRRRGRRWTP